jgi:hypothetical protein
MPVTLYEKVESRNLAAGRNGASFVASFIAIGSDDETVVYQAAVLGTPVSYFGTLFRSDIRTTPRGGGPYFDVEITYAPIPPGEAISSPNLDGGGAPTEQPQAPDPAAPIGPGFSFSTLGGTTKIYQNKETVAIVQSLGAIADGRIKKDHHGAIGVTKDGAEGVDIVSRNTEFQVEVRRNRVTTNYIRGLSALTGSVNDAPFYGFQAGEVLFLGAEGRFSQADLWQVTYKFAFEANRNNFVVSKDENGVAQITIPGIIKGWDYIDVAYYEKFDAGTRLMRPEQAAVHRVYDLVNFNLLEIGA